MFTRSKVMMRVAIKLDIRSTINASRAPVAPFSTAQLLQNNQVRLANRPFGSPDKDTWRMSVEKVPQDLADGDMLVKVNYISLDPAMRGWLNDAKSYIKPVQIGDVMRAIGCGIVVNSKNPCYKPGDAVMGGFGVQQYAVLSEKAAKALDVTKVDPSFGSDTLWLNTLGMPGMTGYFGLKMIGQPKAGETIVVSAAAGAVGQTVGQLANVFGLRTVGIAGGTEKCDWVVNTLGYDACIDYKAGSGAVRAGLKEHCPEGVDIYFDNVGGDILDDVLARINRQARIIICGAISQYNNTKPIAGPKNYLSLLVNRARMEGMVVFDYAQDYPTAVQEMGALLKAGKMTSREHVVEGVENFPDALNMLFKGQNFGKLVLKAHKD